MQNYRKALAGAVVTLGVATAGAFGVDLPAGVEASIVTLLVFALGFVPKEFLNPPEEEPDEASN